MGYFPGGGLGPTGTRVSNRQTDESQWLLYIKQSLVGALACDFILTCILLILLSLGWSVLFISLIVTYWAISFLANKLNWTYQEKIRMATGFLISVGISVFVFGIYWWDWLICREMIILLIVETFTPLKLPSWIYWTLLVFWFFGALKSWGKLTATVIIFGLTLWTVYQIDYTVDFDLIWSRVKYFWITLLVPWIVFGGLLAVAMIKEILAPNLNFVLETLDFETYKDVGGIIGLYLPWLVELKNRVDKIVYNVTVSGRTKAHGQPTQQKRRALFAPHSDDEGLAKFAIALLKGNATFSEKGSSTQNGATHFGYSQPEYKRLRETAYQLGLLNKKGNHYSLNDDGVEAMVNIITWTYPNEDKVPAPYSPTP